MNSRSGELITNVDNLLHPERFTRNELLDILRIFCIEVSSSLPTENIIDVFKKVALPLPQRTGRNCKSRQTSDNLNANIDELKLALVNLNNDLPTTVTTISKPKRIKLNRFSFNDCNVTNQTNHQSKDTVFDNNENMEDNDCNKMLNDTLNKMDIRDAVVNNMDRSCASAVAIEQPHKRVILKRSHLLKGSEQQINKRIKI